jgi:1-acyl-sn-glycerol-3-phosphate acyltransferase
MERKYRRVVAVLQGAFSLLAQVEVEGTEQIPQEGAFILATNHLSRLDTPLLGITCPRQIHPLVAAKYKSHLFFRWFVNTVGGIWVQRDTFDRRALQSSLEILRSGEVLGIAPEGTRSQEARLQPGKPGIAFLAARIGVPIVPVGVSGTELARQAFRHLRRPQFRVTYGPPFHLPKEGRLTSEDLEIATDLIMERIAALLPPPYRGVYAAPAEA